MRTRDRMRVRKIVPNCSACPTRIATPRLRMPRDIRNTLTGLSNVYLIHLVQSYRNH